MAEVAERPQENIDQHSGSGESAKLGRELQQMANAYTADTPKSTGDKGPPPRGRLVEAARVFLDRKAGQQAEAAARKAKIDDLLATNREAQRAAQLASGVDRYQITVLNDQIRIARGRLDRISDPSDRQQQEGVIRDLVQRRDHYARSAEAAKRAAAAALLEGGQPSTRKRSFARKRRP